MFDTFLRESNARCEFHVSLFVLAVSLTQSKSMANKNFACQDLSHELREGGAKC